MSSLSKTNFLSKTEYSVVYSDMGGVDFSGDGSNISRKRFSYLENMYRDYEGDGAGIIESIPGYRKIADFNGSCNGLYSYKNSAGHEIIAAHVLNKVYEFEKDDIDTQISPTVTEGLRHSKSAGFVFGDCLYIMDGLKMFKISSSYKGEINDSNGGIYIPTTYINGKEAEQRNLLTRRFYEKNLIGSCDTVFYESTGLIFAVTNEEKKHCKVVGISSSGEINVYIPSRTKIGDTYYSVTEIGNSAFAGNTSITTCHIANGVTEIGYLAFSGCTSLNRVILGDTVSVIGNGAFSGCDLLSTLFLGSGISDLGIGTFGNCYKLESINYAKSHIEFALIKNSDTIGSRTMYYNSTYKSMVIGIPVNSPCIGILSVKIDGSSVNYRTVNKNGLCTIIKISISDRSILEGKTIIIEGTLSSSPISYSLGWTGFINSVYSANYGSVAEIIKKCTVCSSFDGRIFLSGNPYYPGYVFYSSFDKNGENNPLYFGELNYFCDGTGISDVISMLKTGESLVVFKNEDDGAGSIFYHTPQLSGNDLIQKIYPAVYIHHGFCAKGASISFFDDPVFISDKGISALEKQSVNLERSISTRSYNINSKFLTEDLKNVKLCIWQGYLIASVNGNMYLADSRSTFIGKEGTPEYEWYFLSGIGGYKNDKTVYKYASYANDGFFVHEKCDEIANGEIMSVYDGEKYIYYVFENDKNYEVYPTEEKQGGEFSPASQILSLGNLLFFSDTKGGLYVFNNDKRGIAPPSTSDLSGFDIEDYKNTFARRIHPYYYSFNSHAPRYAIKTAKDNCGIPHLLKNTVKKSLVLKCRVVASGNLCCEVGTENDGYFEICTFPNRDLVFADMDFSSFCLSTNDIYTVPIAEKAKGWIEKQITLYSEKFASPFGIYTIAYRFFVKGKIKK